MLCISTRGQSPAIPLHQAIIEGIAPDGGLYLPEHLPQINLPALLASETYQEAALAVMSPFFASDLLADKLPGMIERAFNFPTPLKQLNTQQDFLLELFHGPTSAFKDVGARFLAECFAAVPAKNKTRTILVATSGDTGGAVAAAFHQHDNVRVVVLFPDGRVSARQAHQLSCFGDNIQSYRVQGSFDDCQRLVKSAFADKALSEQYALTSANSINLGRLLPQMSYYAWAAVQYAKSKGNKQALNFIIPSGNLGNAFAAMLAKTAGAPIGDIVLVTNANTVVPDFFDTGKYIPRDSLSTLANAMDVGAPSNLERLRFLYPEAKIHQAIIKVESAGDDEIRRAIPVTLDKYDEIICPHTACGMVALERLRDAGDTRDWCVVATAHPAKFETVVEPLIQQNIKVPEPLQKLLNRLAHAEQLAPELIYLKAALELTIE
ncbi:MAG: threonine synthase [Arenimonas sp.]